MQSSLEIKLLLQIQKGTSKGIYRNSLSGGHDQLEKFEHLTEELTYALNLEPIEVEIYLTLLKKRDPISTGDLAKDLNINRAKTYRSTDKLVREGIAYSTFSNPKLYYPAKPEQVLKLALHKKNYEINRIESVGKDIIGELRKMVSSEYNTANLPRFQVIQGTSILANIEKIIEESTETMFIVASIKDVARMYHTFIPEKIKISEKKGGEILLFTELEDQKMIPFIKRLDATHTRIGKLPSKGRIIVSRSEMLMADSVYKRSRHAMTGSDYGFCTNSAGMLDYGMYMCEFLWQTGKELK